MVDFPGFDPEENEQERTTLRDLLYTLLYGSVELNAPVMADIELDFLREGLVRLADAIRHRALWLCEEELADSVNLSNLRSGRPQLHELHCFGFSEEELKKILFNRVEKQLAFDFEAIVRDSIASLDLKRMGFELGDAS